MNDDEFHSLICRTHPKPEFSASFQREVWAGIAVAEQRSWACQLWKWSQNLFRWIAQPAPAVTTVLLTLGLGIGLGSLSAPDSKEAMRIAYVTSINPLKAVDAAMQE